MAELLTDETDLVTHPFRIQHIFFLEVFVRRDDEMPEDVFPFNLLVEIALGLPDDGNDYSVNLKVTSVDDESSVLDLRVITTGIFKYLEEGEPSDDVLSKYINEQLLVAMTSRVIQKVGELTAQMGMQPVWLPTPRGFGITVDDVQMLRNTRQEKLEL